MRTVGWEVVSVTQVKSTDSGATRPSIAGAWRNQLGSFLTVEVDDDGVIRGTFHTGTGSTPDKTYPVVGFCDADRIGMFMVLGFVVNWSDNQSITVWSGLYDAEAGTIDATWLMTSETGSADEWKATMVGHDVFRRAAF